MGGCNPVWPCSWQLFQCDDLAHSAGHIMGFRTLCLPDMFQDHDKPDAMYAQAGLDADGIVAGALAALGMDDISAKGRRA